MPGGFPAEVRPFASRGLTKRSWYLVCRGRGVNCTANVPLDRTGRIPRMYEEALLRLQRNLGTLGW